MNSKSRIASILSAPNLDSTITGIETFDLSALQLKADLDFVLPTNLRLGHLIEKIASELIKSSSNFKLHYENVQVIENKNTLGELDFILENKNTGQLFHVEFAYKFYLLDPTFSSEPINNWIGPNRNDSLKVKLQKLKTRQFPLLYHPSAKSIFEQIEIDKASQVLCFLASLFIPYGHRTSVGSSYDKAIKGYYLNLETFTDLDNSEKSYYVPLKHEWGMDPAENENWMSLKDIEKQVHKCMEEKQAPLCWQKQNESYTTFFIVWW